MSKLLKMTHIIMIVLSLLLFIVATVRLIFTWDSLPDDIGVHFAPDGSFDVFDKQYIFYPYIVTIAAIAICEAFEFITRKMKKLGIAVNETGENVLRTAIILLLDLMMLLFSGFFSGIWVDCVLTQQPLNPHLGAGFCNLLFAILIAFPVTFIVVRVKYKKNKKTTSNDKIPKESQKYAAGISCESLDTDNKENDDISKSEASVGEKTTDTKNTKDDSESDDENKFEKTNNPELQ